MSDYRFALPAPVRGLHAVLPKPMRYRGVRLDPQKPLPDQQSRLETMEKTYQERSETAYKHGVEDGTTMGLEQGRHEILPVIEQMKEMMSEISVYRDTLVREVDEIVTHLSLSIAKMLIHREIRQDPELIRQVVKEALRQVEDRRRLSIKVHPEDWQMVKGFEDEVREALHGIKEMEIKEDIQIRRGGCLIESDSGIVDARIDTQLEEIATGILGAYS